MTATIWYLDSWSSPQHGHFSVAIEPSDITGRRDHVGGYLQLPVVVDPATDDLRSGKSLVALEGWLRWNNDAAPVVGIHAPLQPISPNYSYLRVPITPSQIAHIEAARAGENAVFHLTLAGLANVPFQATSTDGGYLATRVVRDNGGQPFMIPKDVWLRVLRETGYGEVRIVELPALSIGPLTAQWNECVRLLTKASDEHRTGWSENAMASSRLIVEGLVTVMAATWGVPRKPGKSLEDWLKELQGRMAAAWPEDTEAAKVLTALYLAVWQWTSEAHHYRSRIPLYQEAAFAVALAGDLMVFAAQLLQAHPEPIKPPPAAASANA